MGEFKIKNTLLTIFNVIFIITFGYIFIDALMRPFHLFVKMNPLVVFVLFILVLLVLYLVNSGLSKCNKKTLGLISTGSFMILALIQLFFFRFFQVNPTWDFGSVYYATLYSMQSFEYLDYYLYFRYPNNIPLFIFMAVVVSWLLKLGVSDVLSPLILINMAVILGAAGCLFLFIYRKYGLQRATLFSLFALLVTPLYTYVPIVYTDTLSMIFPILGLLIYDVFYHSKHKLRLLWIVLLGFVLALGILMKTNVIIFLVGMIIHYFMTQKCIKALSIATVLTTIIILLNVNYQSRIDPYIPVEKSEVGFPTTHWVMMGLNENGGFNEEDILFTENLKLDGLINDEISKAHMDVIKERLNEMGPIGLLKHFRSKIYYTWTDGTYFAPEKLHREPLEVNKYQSLIFGEHNQPYVYMSQAIHLVILFFICLSGVRLFKQKGFEQVMAITMFGVVLFLLIWETRSRYLVLYLPFMIALASFGFDEFLLICPQVKDKIKTGK